MQEPGSTGCAMTRTTQYALGIGCRRGAEAARLVALVEKVLAEAGISVADLSALATIAGKDAEPAVIALGHHLGLSITCFPPDELEAETPRLANPSDIVFRETGCHGVAEASALAALGEEARLVVPKRVLDGCTAALAAGSSL